MKLILHSPYSKSETRAIYQRAFVQAEELYLVTAYLTEWDSSLKLNSSCKSFRVIIGKDFGITRKSACNDVMKWLPAERKSQFMVADEISGFHPKAMFWKRNDGKYFSLIGSSNLTRAAFETNYEANMFSEISSEDFDFAVTWVKEIEELAVVVSEDWLDEYQEGVQSPKKGKKNIEEKVEPIKALILPKPNGSKQKIEARRNQLLMHENLKEKLHKLFSQCSRGKISSPEFYDRLSSFWSWDAGNRLQGLGWERQGKASDFKALSESFMRILKAKEVERDDTVVRELDHLSSLNNSARRAFLSEMLCLTFPDKYPVLNKPVHRYLSDIKFRSPRGSSEGAKYLDLAKKLRISLAQNPKHPAKNLAELDIVIWLEYSE